MLHNSASVSFFFFFFSSFFEIGNPHGYAGMHIQMQ